jgi:hypothetical protein
MYWRYSNKILLLLLVVGVVFILSACGSSDQPAATLTPELAAEPTLTPEPTATSLPDLATNIMDIVGVWEHPLPGVSAFMEIQEDGTFISAGGVKENLADQPYMDGESWFEGNRFMVKIRDSVLPDHKTCIDLIGTYDVQLLADGSLNFVVIEDDCEIRARATLAGVWIPAR